MPKTRLLHRVPHNPDDMLALVTDVERYPDFIKYVSAVRILKRESLSETESRFTADLGIQYKFISERFRSAVNVDTAYKTLSITREGHGGAVRNLLNEWKFIALEDGSTLIDFFIDVRLKAAPLEFLASQKFDKAASYIMQTFEKRAGEVCERVGDADYDWRGDKAAGLV